MTSAAAAGGADPKFQRGQKLAAKASTAVAPKKDAANFRELNAIASGNVSVSGKRTRVAAAKPKYAESSSEDEEVVEPAAPELRVKIT